MEQDLVISRALVEMFCVPELASRLLFRGATALSQLHFTPATRYCEDIDLVQAQPEPIGAIDHLRAVLDPWLGTPRRKLKEGRVNLVYRIGRHSTAEDEIEARDQYAGALQRAW